MATNSVAFWNKTWRREHNRFYKHFDAIVDLLPEKGKVIDVGCGVGSLLKLIEKNCLGLKLEGRDHSPEAIKKLRNRGIKGKVEKLPLISGKADIIIATEVLEHMKDDDAVLQSMTNTAKKIIITVPDDRLGSEECGEHERKYTAESLGNKLDMYFDKYVIYSIEGYLLAVAWNV